MKIARPVALARTRLHECAVTWFLMDVKTNSEDSPINLIPDFPMTDLALSLTHSANSLK